MNKIYLATINHGHGKILYEDKSCLVYENYKRYRYTLVVIAGNKKEALEMAMNETETNEFRQHWEVKEVNLEEKQLISMKDEER